MENLQNKILTSYGFLAALTENNNDLYNYVYVPICKRALSLYSLKGKRQGTAQDIQIIIEEQYGIKAPIAIVKKLIVSVISSLSRRQKDSFKAEYFEQGNSFQLKCFEFADLEDKYRKSFRDASMLNEAFIKYLAVEQIDKDSVPSFSEFIDRHKCQIACFFKGNGDIKKDDIDKTYIYHIQFLEYIDINNDQLFHIAEQLYLGSIVAGFLESGIDLVPKFLDNEVYYIDTPILLRALDLQKEEETQPAQELLNLIRNTGGSLGVLSVTLNELKDVIDNAVKTYSNIAPVTTINDACLRLHKNKTWLINIEAKIEEYILDKLGIEIVNIPQTSIEKYEKRPDVQELKGIRKKKGNAFHDVAAYLFVREQRGKTVNSFQKGKYWFVTSNYDLLIFNKEHASFSGITEIVLPDALISMLWLKDPSKFTKQVKKVGLQELMSATLNEEVASKELIGEFETAISSIEDISMEDYEILLSSIVHQSTKNINSFIELAQNDKEKAKENAIRLVEKEKTRQAQQKLELKEALTSKQKEKEYSNSLQLEFEKLKKEHGEFKTEIEELSNKLNDNKRLSKKVLGSLFIAIVFIAFFVIIIANKTSIILKTIAWIGSLGGLWGFLSFIINLIKLLNSK